MRTSIELDEKLVATAFRYAPVQTKKELVDLALREFVISHQHKDLRDLKGTGGIRPEYNHRELRERDGNE